MAETTIRQSFRRLFVDYVTALGGMSPFGRLIQRAVADPDVRRNFVAAPRETLAAAGVALPDGLEVEVLENTDKIMHLALPPLITMPDAPEKPS